MPEDRFGELLGPYLLGELSDEEERELRRHLEECAACRGELDHLRQTHDLLRLLASSTPPPELKARTMERTAASIPSRSGGGRRWLWAAAAAALLVAAVLGVGFLRGLVGGPSESLPLTATEIASGAGGELRGEVDDRNLQLELEVWDMPELRQGEYYEMWYAREGGGRISCGTFHAQSGDRTTVNLSAPLSATSYPEIEVTREPDDGAPGSSGEVVLVGDLRDL